jgi:hypothetical protein
MNMKIELRPTEPTTLTISMNNSRLNLGVKLIFLLLGTLLLHLIITIILVMFV